MIANLTKAIETIQAQMKEGGELTQEHVDQLTNTDDPRTPLGEWAGKRQLKVLHDFFELAKSEKKQGKLDIGFAAEKLIKVRMEEIPASEIKELRGSGAWGGAVVGLVTAAIVATAATAPWALLAWGITVVAGERLANRHAHKLYDTTLPTEETA